MRCVPPWGLKGGKSRLGILARITALKFGLSVMSQRISGIALLGYIV